MTSNKSKLNEIIKSFSDYNNSFNIYNSFVLNKENYVMYILVNKSLSMKSGKIAAQVGHAVQKVTQYCMIHQKILWNKYCSSQHAKVVLKVPTEEKFLEILIKLKDILKLYVVDAGRTQIPANSVTAVGFLPMLKSEVPECLKELKLF